MLRLRKLVQNTSFLVKNVSRNYASQKMAFNVYGSADEAPPLIVMHGLFGSKQNWRGIGKALEKKLSPKRRIYAVDARNHGESFHSPEHSYGAISRDIKEFLKQEGIPKAAVMGHSMGGRAMMYFALENPDLVDKLIVVDISPVNVPRDFDYMKTIIQNMIEIDVPADLSMAQGRKVAEKKLINLVGRGTVDFIMLNLKKMPDGQFGWSCNVDALYNNFEKVGDMPEDILRKGPFNGPVMFIGGNLADFLDPADWPEIQTIFPNSELHMLETGHLVHFEDPQTFMGLITNFLKK